MDRKRQEGFSLVEVLVGLVIGLLAMLAVFQTLALFESQRRTTSEGADMQQNGLSALYALEQDIRLGGYGLIDNGSMPCFTINAYGSPQSIFQSVPIQIADGGTGGSDTLVTARLDSDTGGVATGGGRAQIISASQSSITVDTGRGLKANDYILISQPPNLACSLLQVSSTYSYPTPVPTPAPDPSTISLVAVANPAGTSGTPSFPSYSGNTSNPYAVIVDIGQSAPFVTSTYSVSSGNLVESDNGGAAQAVTGNIVNIQAQYGVAPAGSQSINCWTDAVGSHCSPSSGDWANPSSADFERVKAIRIAIVARSDLKEKPSSGTTCNATATAPTAWPSAGLPPGSSNPPTIDLSSDPNWQCYRYKVYSTIVHLRNVIWGNL